MKSILRTLTILAFAAMPFWAAAEEAKPATPPPAPSLEQRVAGLEAYLGNGDPSAPLKDAKGNDHRLPIERKAEA